MSKINSAGFVALIFQKGSQIHALWAVYTAVQFALGSFGISQYHDAEKMPATLGFAVLLGVWTFNLGHLSMVLLCTKQIFCLRRLIPNGTLVDPADERDVDELAGTSLLFARSPDGWKAYIAPVAVHLVIDICASIALLSRVGLRLFT